MSKHIATIKANAHLMGPAIAAKLGISSGTLSAIARKHGLTYGQSFMKAAILAEIKRDPLRKGHEIAEAANTRASMISKVARESGILYGEAAIRERERAKTIRAVFCKANASWLKAECEKTGVNLEEMLDAIVTDARLDELYTLEAEA